MSLPPVPRTGARRWPQATPLRVGRAVVVLVSRTVLLGCVVLVMGPSGGRALDAGAVNASVAAHGAGRCGRAPGGVLGGTGGRGVRHAHMDRRYTVGRVGLVCLTHGDQTLDWTVCVHLPSIKRT